ncbi:MAG: hypothetical protein AVDCRST_MAG56-4088 [uncultured Cytophagales bacterium]|uniref:DUF3298 domain-containing protein n=1 Tax=uncultured Cytophagales bacterium TaxID=158755 RepID=A0A6J4JRD5_9SPHI|nr:MAG: hypothetical protein AVDCRST_MAG56-4088 [uncultured Cytophagales bacterium]
MPSFTQLIFALRLGLLLGLAVLAGRPESCRAQSNPKTTAPAQAVGTAAEKTYAGSIAGKYPITMRLRKDGTALTGSYAYTRVGQDIRLDGTVQADGTFSLKEFDDKGQETGQFAGKIGPDGTVTGTWRKPGSDKTSSLALRETPAGAADAVAITEYRFSVKGPNDTEGEYAFPRVTGPAGHPALAKLNAQLTVKQLTGETEQEIRENFAACGCGLTATQYTVDYNRNGVLALSVAREWHGAYPSFSGERLVFSTRTGNRLSVGQLLRPAALPELARQCDKLLQARVQEARRAAAGNVEEAAWLDELVDGKTFTAAQLAGFTVTGEGITFYYPFGFPHAVLALQPDDAFSFTFDQLKPYLKPDGPLAAEIK